MFTKKNLGPTNMMVVRFDSEQYSVVPPGKGFSMTVTAEPSGKIRVFIILLMNYFSWKYLSKLLFYRLRLPIIKTSLKSNQMHFALYEFNGCAC